MNKADANPVTVSVVRSVDELIQVCALRAQIYISEQNCPYFEEFDGNDLCGATHLLARCGVEPVGTMRIRWFADFAKFERICVRSEFRGGRVAPHLVQRAYALAARKGYIRVLAHAQANLVSHWQAVAGMRRRPGRRSFRFSDIDYVEVERRLKPANNALRIDSPPLELVRPEGDWDRPGILEESAARTPTPSSIR